MHQHRLIALTFAFTLLLAPAWASALTPEQVQGHDFELVDADNKVLAKRVRLKAGGKLEGVSAKRAHSWAIVDRIVVFYGRDKKPTCRFSRVRTSNGKLAMRGTSTLERGTTWVLRERGYVPPVKHPRAAVTRKQVMSRRFVFSIRRGKELAKNVRLLASGKIGGYKAINAKKWDLVDGKVVFFDKEDKPSVRFTTIRSVRGKLQLMGSFIKNRKITMVLSEKGFGN